MTDTHGSTVTIVVQLFTQLFIQLFIQLFTQLFIQISVPEILTFHFPTRSSIEHSHSRGNELESIQLAQPWFEVLTPIRSRDISTNKYRYKYGSTQLS